MVTEEALIRHDQLGSKSYNKTLLRTIQLFLAHRDGCRCEIEGTEASVWGYLDKDSPLHAIDMIQVIQPLKSSVIGQWLTDRFLSWIPHLPKCVLHNRLCSKSGRDAFQVYPFNIQTCDYVLSALANVLTSLLVYIAVTVVYFPGAKTLDAIMVVVIAVIVTACSILFQNQQYLSMLGT